MTTPTPLRELLEEVRQCFTRDDDLPNGLLPRIDAALDGPTVAGDERKHVICVCPDCITTPTPLRELLLDLADRIGRAGINGFGNELRDLAEEAALSARDEAGAVSCGACGKEWDGQKCGQAENGWPFPVCYPIATPPAAADRAPGEVGECAHTRSYAAPWRCAKCGNRMDTHQEPAR